MNTVKCANSLTLNYIGGEEEGVNTSLSAIYIIFRNLCRTGLFPAAVFLLPVLNHPAPLFKVQ